MEPFQPIFTIDQRHGTPTAKRVIGQVSRDVILCGLRDIERLPGDPRRDWREECIGCGVPAAKPRAVATICGARAVPYPFQPPQIGGYRFFERKRGIGYPQIH